jgi:hypothetical protein
LKFQILEQDERFLLQKEEKLHNRLEFVATNGITIISDCWPEIYPPDDIIYLRGEYRDRDDYIDEYTFSSIKERDCFEKKMIDAIKEWAESAPEFREEETIYEF